MRGPKRRINKAASSRAAAFVKRSVILVRRLGRVVDSFYVRSIPSTRKTQRNLGCWGNYCCYSRPVPVPPPTKMSSPTQVVRERERATRGLRRPFVYGIGAATHFSLPSLWLPPQAFVIVLVPRELVSSHSPSRASIVFSISVIGRTRRSGKRSASFPFSFPLWGKRR